MELAQPLAHLAQFAQRIADRVWIDQEDAVLYLLADEVVWWPSAQAFVEWRPRFAMIVRVEWPFTDPKAVSDLFTRLRGSLFLKRSASDDDCRAAGLSPRMWAMELAHFVGERRAAGVSWGTIRDEWNVVYPEHQHLTAGGLRSSFAAALERALDPAEPMMDALPDSAAPWRPTLRPAGPQKLPEKEAQAVIERQRKTRRRRSVPREALSHEARQHPQNATATGEWCSSWVSRRLCAAPRAADASGSRTASPAPALLTTASPKRLSRAGKSSSLASSGRGRRRRGHGATDQERERGDHVRATDLTMAEYLTGRWLPALAAEELAPGTLLAYQLHVRRINGYVGRIPLQALTRSDVAVLTAKLANEVGARGRVLSPATRRAVLVLLHHALGDAVRDGLLRSNPATGVRRPKVRQPEMKTWNRQELASFLAATRENRLSPLWRLLAMTGLRRGEALGLKWPDVDLAAGRLSIQRQRVATGYEVAERQTKTGRGRSVSIDSATAETLRQQSERQLDDAREWGAAWQSTGHVFTRENGEPWHPDRVRILFGQAVAALDVPRIRLHDLRHTWATLALQAGIHPKVVQERLGHANIAITMDRYAHVLPNLQESAAELVAALVDGAGVQA